MLENVLIKDSELVQYTDKSDLQSRTRALTQHQLNSWEMANTGYKQLESVETRKFEFDDFIIKVQFNKGRIISSSAKVDKDSIKLRKCFLCYKHLPENQKGLPYFRDYLILVNPFPIFPEHFTIPKIDHLPQLITGNLEGMLKLTKDIGKDYTVFYNGPKCGASAPDHMHFQAGTKNFMPIDTELKNILSSKSENIYETEYSRILGVKNYLGKMFYIESEKLKDICYIFRKLYSTLERAPKFEEEPMMNIVSYYDQNKWKLIVFPRLKHRPDYYFKEGPNKILLSPAAVDLGGVCITPREEDFNKITKDNIIDIFRQVSISNEYYEFYKVKFWEALIER